MVATRRGLQYPDSGGGAAEDHASDAVSSQDSSSTSNTARSKRTARSTRSTTSALAAASSGSAAASEATSSTSTISSSATAAAAAAAAEASSASASSGEVLIVHSPPAAKRRRSGHAGAPPSPPAADASADDISLLLVGGDDRAGGGGGGGPAVSPYSSTGMLRPLPNRRHGAAPLETPSTAAPGPLRRSDSQRAAALSVAPTGAVAIAPLAAGAASAAASASAPAASNNSGDEDDDVIVVSSSLPTSGMATAGARIRSRIIVGADSSDSDDVVFLGRDSLQSESESFDNVYSEDESSSSDDFPMARLFQGGLASLLHFLARPMAVPPMDYDFLSRLQPVRVGVPQSRLRSLPSYRVASRQGLREESCSVCLDQYKPNEVVLELPCSHQFHKRCVVRWLNSSKVCPLCRADVE